MLISSYHVKKISALPNLPKCNFAILQKRVLINLRDFASKWKNKQCFAKLCHAMLS